MKIHKGADDAGLVAELLKNSPDDFQADLLRLLNNIFYAGNFPSSWSRTLFQMLANTARAQQPSDVRPIANIRLLYKTFAFMILVALKHCWKQFSRKNNPDSENIGGWMNTC